MYGHLDVKFIRVHFSPPTGVHIWVWQWPSRLQSKTVVSVSLCQFPVDIDTIIMYAEFVLLVGTMP